MRGAGPVAVLKLLERGEMYGYELVEALAARTAGVLAMGQSTLYPLLYNLEAKGLIESYWQKSAAERDRKYYRLTPKGHKRLAADIKGLAYTVDDGKIVATPAAQSAPVLTVPRSAVLEAAGGTFVFVVNGATYLRTAVKTGARSADHVEITDGLYAGDTVVTTAVDQLWLAELRLTKGGGHSH